MATQNSSSTDSNGELPRTQLYWIRTTLDTTEKSGFTTLTKEQILAASKASLVR